MDFNDRDKVTPQARVSKPPKHHETSPLDSSAPRSASLSTKKAGEEARLQRALNPTNPYISQVSHVRPPNGAVVLAGPNRQPPGSTKQSTLPGMWALSRHVGRETDTKSASSESTPPRSPKPTSSNRGRPKGWKPGMSYAMMRGNDPQQRRAPRHARPKAPGVARRPGRPPRAPSPTARQVYETTECSFVVFVCEWEGCKAELHNADTLRRHVRLVHGRGDGERACRWRKCRAGNFKDVRSWRSHLEQAHLIPVEWHLGDGPRNTSDAPCKVPDALRGEVPDYLLGPDGQQVTPSIRDQQLEDFATWRDNRRRLKELLIQRDNNLPDESSESSDEFAERLAGSE